MVAPDDNVSPMGLHDVFHQTQPHAAAFGVVDQAAFYPVELVKYFLLFHLRDTDTVIPDGENQSVFHLF